MLSYYGIKECYDTVKEWYDGYQFGETDVYCPWDVINYCKNRSADVNALPEDYWSNTSGNAWYGDLLTRQISGVCFLQPGI